MVRGGVQRSELIGRRFLQLVDKNEGADLEVACGVSEGLEERRQIVGEASRVGDALHGLYVDAEADIARWVDAQAECLEHSEQAAEPTFRVAAGRGAQR